MAIEMRNGKPYSYTSRRIGARVVREYQGCGLVANLSVRLDEATRTQRKIDRHQEQAQLANSQRINAKLRKWMARINATVAEAMMANGWHLHNREWRLKRGNTMGTLAKTETACSTWVPSELGAMVAEGLSPEVEKKSKQGDRSIMPEIDRFLDNAAAVALYGDVGRFVLHQWVLLQAGENVLWGEAILRFASDMRTRLAGANPTALDYLLAERVVIGWIFVNFSEMQYTSQIEKVTSAQAKYHFQRIELANRNLMSACRTLAKVKKAKLPDVLAVVIATAPVSDKTCVKKKRLQC